MDEGGFQIVGHSFDVPFRRRSDYQDYTTFRVDDALDVFVSDRAAQTVQSRVAEAAPRESGGLLIGRSFRDDHGRYVVVTDAVCARHEAGAMGSFTLSPAETDALRREAAVRYPSGDAVGWWHSHLRPSEFSATDRHNQSVWKDQHDLGLLVFAAGSPWARMYAGPTSRGGVFPLPRNTAPPLPGIAPPGRPSQERQADQHPAFTILGPEHSQVPVTAGPTPHRRPLTRRSDAIWWVLGGLTVALGLLLIVQLSSGKGSNPPSVSSNAGKVTMSCSALTEPSGASPEEECRAHGRGRMTWFVDGRLQAFGPTLTFPMSPPERYHVTLRVNGRVAQSRIICYRGNCAG